MALECLQLPWIFHHDVMHQRAFLCQYESLLQNSGGLFLKGHPLFEFLVEPGYFQQEKMFQLDNQHLDLVFDVVALGAFLKEEFENQP